MREVKTLVIKEVNKEESLSFDVKKHDRLYINRLNLPLYQNIVYDELLDMVSYKSDRSYYLIPILSVY